MRYNVGQFGKMIIRVTIVSLNARRRRMGEKIVLFVRLRRRVSNIILEDVKGLGMII